MVTAMPLVSPRARFVPPPTGPHVV